VSKQEPKDPSASESMPQKSLVSIPESKSKTFLKVLEDVARFARFEFVTIIFEGEMGTGKNWLARMAHDLSPRRQHQMQTIDLAEHSEALIASDLFGHERGSFTGACTKRLGAFVIAHKGTLLIDEIGKASIPIQKHLLRALDEHKITPVGSDREIAVDARILTASNENLQSLVDQGLFLPDLYARLGLFKIRVTELRKRREDIPDLARYFLDTFAVSGGHKAGDLTIHPELIEALTQAEWKLNVRGLRNAIYRLAVQADPATELTLGHCVGELAYLRTHTPGRPKKASTAQIAGAVEQSKSKAAAARDLEISRATLYRKLAAPDDQGSADGSVSA
jgi:DNA-binding NtrC family response regulator